jgi:hypothetical protein
MGAGNVFPELRGSDLGKEALEGHGCKNESSVCGQVNAQAQMRRA